MFKHKASYALRISYCSPDICSSYLRDGARRNLFGSHPLGDFKPPDVCFVIGLDCSHHARESEGRDAVGPDIEALHVDRDRLRKARDSELGGGVIRLAHVRSEEHTSELQSIMRISYAVFCLKKKTINNKYTTE